MLNIISTWIPPFVFSCYDGVPRRILLDIWIMPTPTFSFVSFHSTLPQTETSVTLLLCHKLDIMKAVLSSILYPF